MVVAQVATHLLRFMFKICISYYVKGERSLLVFANRKRLGVHITFLFLFTQSDLSKGCLEEIALGDKDAQCRYILPEY